MKICLIIIFSLSFVTLKSQTLDYKFLKQIQKNRNYSRDKVFDGISQSADFVGITTPLGLIAAGFISKDPKLKKEGLSSALALFGTYGVGYILKKSIDRPRPFIDHPEFVPFRFKESGSMPSGSTAVAFSSATALTLVTKKWYVAIPAYTYAGAVAYSRLHLAEHYPTDVLAGAVLGAGSVIISRKLTNWVNKKR